MKLKINREVLLPALASTVNVVEKRQTLPILSNLLIKQEGDTLSITGSDLEVEVCKNVPDLEASTVNFTLSASKIYDICRTLPANADINLDIHDDAVVLKSGRSRYNLKTLPSAEFPSLQHLEFTDSLRINAQNLKHILDLTSFSMASQDVRFYLNGVLFDIEGQVLTVVTTDGHRLSKSELALDTASTQKYAIIVPRKAITELNRLLTATLDQEGDDATVLVDVSTSHIKVSNANTVITSTLIDGQFPEYKSIIEVDLDKTLTVNRADLLASLNRVSVLTNDKFHGVKLLLNDSLLKITTTNNEQEEVNDELNCTFTSNVGLATSFNVQYLTEALKINTCETIQLKIKDKDSVCVIKNEADEKSLWLIMPMRV